MISDLWPFMLFSLASSVTPGPNNVMVSAAAANHGVRATAPHVLGIAAGMVVMLLLVGAGLAGPFASSALLYAVVRWIGVFWMLHLAWKIASADVAVDLARGDGKPPLSFFGAVLFQWVNPKAWLIALATTATYTVPDRALLPQVTELALITGLVCVPCVALWAVLGAAAGRVLIRPAQLRAFNIAMALLLALSLIPLLWE